MEPIQNIAVAEPAAALSDDVIAYALSLAGDLSAKLTIALCFPGTATEASCSQESAREAFQHLKSHCLAGTSVDYRLVSNHRDRCEEADASLAAFRPDMLIISTEHISQMEALIRKVRYPLLLMSPRTPYRRIRQIAVVYDTDLEPLPVFPHLAYLASGFEAKVHVVEINPASLSIPEPTYLPELNYLLKETDHAFHVFDRSHAIDKVVRFVHEKSVDLLVMLTRLGMPGETCASEQHTAAIIQQAAIPVMVLKV